MNQNEPLWPSVEIYAIGDSHVSFFRGHDGGAGLEHRLPGAYTLQTSPHIDWQPGRPDDSLAAWSEVQSAVEHAVQRGFQGWILLSYGALDLRANVYKISLETGNLVQTVYDTVERYVRFIDAVRRVYPKLAIWAPVATQTYDAAFAATAPAIGSEAERNFLTLLFTRTLSAHLAQRDVPLISITDLLLLPDGRTNRELYLPDHVHVSQTLMPHAVRLINAALGTTLQAVTLPTHFAPYPLCDFARVQETEIQGRVWLGFEFESALYTFAVYLLGNAARPIGHIEICASFDGQSFEIFEGELNHVPPPGAAPFIAIERLSRFLFIRSDQYRFAAEDVRIDVISTRFIPGFPGNGHNTELFSSISEALLTAQPPRTIDSADHGVKQRVARMTDRMLVEPNAKAPELDNLLAAEAAPVPPQNARELGAAAASPPENPPTSLMSTTVPVALPAIDILPADPPTEYSERRTNVSDMIAAALARMATVTAELPQPATQNPEPPPALIAPRSVTQMFAATPAPAAAAQRETQPVTPLQPRPTIEPRAAMPTVKDEIRLGRSIRSFAIDD